MKSSQTINGVSYHLPESSDDVLILINQAKEHNKTIAVRGSAHSIPLVKTNEENGKYMYILLSEMYKIQEFDNQTGIVKVQAGCHLGIDPFDPTGISTLENSLAYQLDPFDIKNNVPDPNSKSKWALPDLGGISHQTVGGFVATGSSGGSIHSNFEKAIISVDIAHYDGNNAVIKTFSQSENKSDPFYGIALANLGLMGITVSVTFQCIPSYYIFGNEVTTTTEQCSIDLFGAGVTPGKQGKLSVQNYFSQKNIYSRFMWWPQKGIDKMTVWQASAKDAKKCPNFKSKPYRDLPYLPPALGGYTLANIAVHYIYSALDNWPDWLVKKFGGGERTEEAIQKFVAGIDDFLLKFILKIFEPNNKPQNFQDIWWHGLPMDNAASDKLFPVWFTELWIPIDQTQKVMNKLKTIFENPLNAGTFSTEIYAAGKSDFWLSPAYGTDVIRIDVYWFGNDHNGTPQEYYKAFWEGLAEFRYRPHWGKFLPPHDGNNGSAYLKSRYPMWKKWKELRSQMDPNDLFLTDYWKTRLIDES